MLNAFLRELLPKRRAAGEAPSLDRAQALFAAKRHVEAEAVILALAARGTNDAQWHYMLAKVRAELGRVDAAEDEYVAALELAPQSAQIHYEYGNLLLRTPRIDDAIARFARAIELEPAYKAAETNLIYSLNFSDRCGPEEVYRAHLAWAERYAEPLTRAAARPQHVRRMGEPLRVGYVSAHFRDNAVTYFFEPVLRHHDTRAFSIYCYSDVETPDARTERLRAYGCTWRETSNLADEELVDLVRADEIDLLVDLTGHIKGDRLLAFARRAAPLQLTWNGYVNTTGMSAMDYRITDVHADPAGTTDRFHTERLLRMPEIFEPFEEPLDDIRVAPLPALARGYVTFGSFNAAPKITRCMLDAWAAVLRAVDSARLLILAVPEGRSHRQIRQAFERNGVDPRRVELRGRVPHADFVSAHNEVDIALDTFPFNGCTTTAYALWMGVPVVTLAGNTHASRVSCSMLTNIGLPELIAGSDADYVSNAIELARDAGQLSELRANLRSRMRAAPNMDGARFTRFLEEAYRRIWAEHRREHSLDNAR